MKSLNKLEKKIRNLDNIEDINKKKEKYNELKKKINKCKDDIENYSNIITNPDEFKSTKTIDDIEKFTSTMNQTNDIKKMVDNYIILYHYIKNLDSQNQLVKKTNDSC